MHVLSSEQVKLLESFGVSMLLGKNGVEFVEGTIKKSDFDPATAMSEIQEANQTIQDAMRRADSIIGAF